jgi:phosphate transport system substrate-binding protein
MKQLLVFIFLSVFAFCTTIFNSCTRCSGPNHGKTLKGEITISGAFALYPITVKWAEEFRKEYPDVEIDVSAGGAGKGMTDVLSGMVDLAMVSREIKKEEFDKGAWSISVAKDAVVPIINSANPILKEIQKNGVKRQILVDIFINNKVDNWSQVEESENKAKIDVFTRSDACGAGEMWGKYLGKNQEALLGVGVYGDPGIADAVKKDVNGLGYNNVLYAYDTKTRKYNKGIIVLPLDVNNNGVLDENERFYDNLDSLMNAIQDGRYPSPPARELYFVSKGRPHNKAVKEFIRWILTDGQKFVKESGYVQLSEDRRNEELKKLKLIHWPLKKVKS